MTENNSYWQFQPSMINNTPSAPPMMLQQPQRQPQWTGNDSDKRKWSQSFGDFDMNQHANKMFHMDDYSNNDPNSEGDSPDSNGGGSNNKHHDLQGGDQKQRRKEQNRAAQRAFRERKEKYVKELQVKIKEMEKKHHDELNRVVKENDSLKQLVKKMEAEIYTLKGAAIAFDVSIHKLREAGLDVQQRSMRTSGEVLSPPHSDRHSPVSKMDDFPSIAATIRDQGGCDNLSITDEDELANRKEEFAERETNRFEHHIDSIVHTGVKLIPCSQIWERLSQHPNFEEFDMDRLCEELKKKAKCSGHGPVIPESELQEVLDRMDAGIA